jgi:hypothetical protein
MRRTIFVRAPCGFVFLAVRVLARRAGFRFVAFAFVRFFFDGAFARAFFLRAGAALRFGFRFAVVFRPRRPVAMWSLAVRTVARSLVRCLAPSRVAARAARPYGARRLAC